MLTRFILLAVGLALSTQAQLFGDGDGQYADFPATCVSSCEAFESASANCAIGDSATSEAASFACMCTDANARALESCSSCILTNSADPEMSNSAGVARQLSISFTRGCGMPLTVEGVSPQVSSVLADGGADYASERSALLTATDNTSKTVSNGMEVTITLSSDGTASPTASPSKTSSPAGSSAPPAATQGDGSGAATVVASFSAVMLGAVAVLAQVV